jgi:hypothetical protein
MGGGMRAERVGGRAERFGREGGFWVTELSGRKQGVLTWWREKGDLGRELGDGGEGVGIRMEG